MIIRSKETTGPFASIWQMLSRYALILWVCILATAAVGAESEQPPTVATTSGIVSFAPARGAVEMAGIATIIHIDDQDIYAVTLAGLLGNAKSLQVRVSGLRDIMDAEVTWVSRAGGDVVQPAVLRFHSSSALREKLKVIPPALPRLGYPRIQVGDRVSVTTPDAQYSAKVQRLGQAYTFALVPENSPGPSVRVILGAPVAKDDYIVGYVTGAEGESSIAVTSQRLVGMMVEGAAIPWDTQPPKGSPAVAPLQPAESSVFDILSAQADGTLRGGEAFVVGVAGQRLLAVTSGANLAGALRSVARSPSWGQTVPAYPLQTIAMEGNELFSLALVGVTVPADVAAYTRPLLPPEALLELPTPGTSLTLLRSGQDAEGVATNATMRGRTGPDGMQVDIKKSAPAGFPGTPLLSSGRVVGMLFDPTVPQYAHALQSSAVARFLQSNGVVWGLSNALVTVRSSGSGASQTGTGIVVYVAPDRSRMSIVTATQLVEGDTQPQILANTPGAAALAASVAHTRDDSVVLLQVDGPDHVGQPVHHLELPLHLSDVTAGVSLQITAQEMAGTSKTVDVRVASTDGATLRLDAPPLADRMLGSLVFSAGQVVGVVTGLSPPTVTLISSESLRLPAAAQLSAPSVAATLATEAAWLVTADVLMQHEVNELNIHEGLHAPVSIGEGSDASSDADGVSIGKELLTRVRAAVGDALAPEAVRWIVAHEYGHQVQASLSLTFQTPQQRELHADSLAGIWMFRGLANLGDATTNYWTRIDGVNEQVRARSQSTVKVLEKVLSTPDIAWNDTNAHGELGQRIAAALNGEYEWVAVINELVRRSHDAVIARSRAPATGDCSAPDWWRLADFSSWSNQQARAITIYAGTAEPGFGSTLNMLRQGIDGRVLDTTLSKHCGGQLPAFIRVAETPPALQPVTEDAALVFLRLRQRAADAHARFREGPSADDASRIGVAADVLRQKWEKSPASLTPEYLATLQDDRFAIEDALSATDTGKARELLGYAREDLEIKAEHATRLATAADTLGPSVAVTVTTTLAEKPVNGYLIRCNKKRSASNPDAQFVFNNPTPDALRALPPGSYVFWGELAGEQTRRIPETIGDQGETSQKIILPVD